MPVCKLCNNSFPNRIKIDGVVKSLSSRKFCLSCSPFGERNTRNLLKSNDKFKVCPKCNEEKNISDFSLRNKNRDKPSSYCKLCISNSYNYRRKDLKIMAVKYKGGKCIYCSYDKCLSSLHFHHLNPKTKSFSISSACYSINKIKEELDKCILVCSNCHGEIHEGLLEVKSDIDLNSNNINPDNKPYYSHSQNKSISNRCNCGKEISKKSKFCSLCYKRPNKITWPSYEELKTMTQSNPMSSIAKKLGVSNTAVKKRLMALSRIELE